ncbi:hypothetical protein A3A95_03245 [Candidatus Nomurabacteria bacterium RIFCSPLOWO2_01_FULL_39_18]|uniref:UDP-N-acetylmuramate--L-alanine ligase n=1 Tax=Candidatus Nomurabacteria bacterium RIFCSPHIGHO2_01_FULL_40_24b TaxID=1801739 RepID=A0A1F6V990_9BACT|nr:MAG: hypothetical protein A2647_00050 [Candidatus Nomurabacteria bacterium RIFCSPHIGHO2_01_FULL_40_24b]OGI90895.1 MAG: hypothetical protein A3A95_03245 [Candidatus Nomurabacteria bacterium RIFCSPLOWO2_01_FULL_39_18]
MQTLDLSKIKKVFFIGIGGIGISALAKMVKAQGIETAGLNDEETGKTLDTLHEAGVEITLLRDFKNLPEADMYVYSDAWIYRGPEILENARSTGEPVLSYFEALGEFAKKYKVIAVSGTHGKTTTTAMISGMLVDAGLDPTCIVGSFVKKFGSNFREGKSEYFVVEADEYMRHLLNFTPFIGVVTNIEADHLDYYKDLADVQSAFRQFISQSEHGIMDYTKYLEKVPKLSVPGEYNKMNAAAALAVADILGIPEETAKKSLAGFEGTWRRLEKKGETPEGTIIYDDYSHHPTEVQVAIGALRGLYPDKTITVLFQPHLYSRTKALFNDFAKSFKGADRVLLLPIYFAREAKDESISSEKLAEAICQNGDNAQVFPDFESAERAVLNLKLGPSDVFVTMGAGEAYKVADKVFKIS